LIYRAPGKIVLWGEYAVLAGAPAAIAAVNRYASVEITPQADSWSFASTGFLTPGVHNFSGQFTDAPCAAMAECVLSYFDLDRLPAGFNLVSDTGGFYHPSDNKASRPAKYGLGSSAAVCTATYCALADFVGRNRQLDEAMAIHRAFQNGKGSGLDVAASWHGGVIRFQNGNVQPQPWPDNLHWQAVWTGSSAATDTALGHFAQWQTEADTAPLDALVEASALLCHAFSMDNLAGYTQSLGQLDEAAKLNIFTPAHQRLATIAHAHDLIYKPCGAGGGDIGIAVGEDLSAVQQFCSQAAAQNYVPLNLEIAPHGVEKA
jgi:phosphomevalonate kinase